MEMQRSMEVNLMRMLTFCFTEERKSDCKEHYPWKSLDKYSFLSCSLILKSEGAGHIKRLYFDDNIFYYILSQDWLLYVANQRQMVLGAGHSSSG